MDSSTQQMQQYSYYVTFTLTPKEVLLLREAFGRDLYGKGVDYQDQNIPVEQVHRILTRVKPAIKKWLSVTDLLPHMKRTSVLTESETQLLLNHDLRPQEQAIRLVEILMNKGTLGVVSLYLALIDSSDALPTHYQLLGELKEIIQSECYVSDTSQGVTMTAQADQRAIQIAIRKLRGIVLSFETAQKLIKNLSLNPNEFHIVTATITLSRVCQFWQQKRSTCFYDELVEGLVVTQGLGRYTSSFCASKSTSESPALRNFFLTLNGNWRKVAHYLGYTDEEVEGICEKHRDSSEKQVTHFLRVWRLPDLGQRTQPLLHRLKSLAGIVEIRTTGKRRHEQSDVEYMHKHLKTDATGMPHRSLDSYQSSHTLTPPLRRYNSDEDHTPSHTTTQKHFTENHTHSPTHSHSPHTSQYQHSQESSTSHTHNGTSGSYGYRQTRSSTHPYQTPPTDTFKAPPTSRTQAPGSQPRYNGTHTGTEGQRTNMYLLFYVHPNASTQGGQGTTGRRPYVHDPDDPIIEELPDDEPTEPTATQTAVTYTENNFTNSFDDIDDSPTTKSSNTTHNNLFGNEIFDQPTATVPGSHSSTQQQVFGNEIVEPLSHGESDIHKQGSSWFGNEITAGQSGSSVDVSGTGGGQQQDSDCESDFEDQELNQFDEDEDEDETSQKDLNVLASQKVQVRVQDPSHVATAVGNSFEPGVQMEERKGEENNDALQSQSGVRLDKNQRVIQNGDAPPLHTHSLDFTTPLTLNAAGNFDLNEQRVQNSLPVPQETSQLVQHENASGVPSDHQSVANNFEDGNDSAFNSTSEASIAAVENTSNPMDIGGMGKPLAGSTVETQVDAGLLPNEGESFASSRTDLKQFSPSADKNNLSFESSEQEDEGDERTNKLSVSSDSENEFDEDAPKPPPTGNDVNVHRHATNVEIHETLSLGVTTIEGELNDLPTQNPVSLNPPLSSLPTRVDENSTVASVPVSRNVESVAVTPGREPGIEGAKNEPEAFETNGQNEIMLVSLTEQPFSSKIVEERVSDDVDPFDDPLPPSSPTESFHGMTQTHSLPPPFSMHTPPTTGVILTNPGAKDVSKVEDHDTPEEQNTQFETKMAEVDTQPTSLPVSLQSMQQRLQQPLEHVYQLEQRVHPPLPPSEPRVDTLPPPLQSEDEKMDFQNVLDDNETQMQPDTDGQISHATNEVVLKQTHTTAAVPRDAASSTEAQPDQTVLPQVIVVSESKMNASQNSFSDSEERMDHEPNNFVPNDLSVEGGSTTNLSDVESIHQDNNIVMNNLSDNEIPEADVQVHTFHHREDHQTQDFVERDNVTRDKNKNDKNNHQQQQTTGDNDHSSASSAHVEIESVQFQGGNADTVTTGGGGSGGANVGASNVTSDQVATLPQEFLGRDIVMAIEENSEEMLMALLESGANVTVPTQDTGTYAVHLAASSGHHDQMMMLLSKNVDVNVHRKSDCRTPLHLACIEQDFQMVTILIDNGANPGAQDDKGLTPLHFQETLKSIEILEYLVHHGAPVDLPTKDDYLTPLVMCCRLGNEGFEAACLLVTSGASVDGHPSSATKPLIVASSEGCEPIVDLLLQHHANINITDQNGNTALLSACKNVHVQVARRLCKKNSKVDANLKNKEGLCPLTVAVRAANVELVEVVLKSGADVNVTMLSTQTLVGGKSEEVEMTPLAEAAVRGNLDVIEKLVDYRAEVNIIGQMRYSPISFACLGGHVQVVEFLLKLNDFDCSLNGISQPFKMAVQSNHYQCAELMAARFANGLDGLLQTAIDRNMQELIQCIEQFKRGPPQPPPTPQQALAPQASPTPQPPASNTPESLANHNLSQPLPLDNGVPQLHASIHPSDHVPLPTSEVPGSRSSTTGSLALSEVQNHLDRINNQAGGGDDDDNEINQFDDTDEDEGDCPPGSVASGNVQAADNPDIGFGQSVLNDAGSNTFDLSQSHSVGSGWGSQNVGGVASVGHNSVVASDSEASSVDHRSLNQFPGVSEQKHVPSVAVPPQDQQEVVVMQGHEQEELNNLETASTTGETGLPNVTLAGWVPPPSQAGVSQASDMSRVSSVSQPSIAGSTSPPMQQSSEQLQTLSGTVETSSSSLQSQQPQLTASLSHLSGDSIHLSSLQQLNNGGPTSSLSGRGPSSLPPNVGTGLNEQQSAPWRMSDGPPPRATGPVMRTTSTERDSTAGGSGSNSGSTESQSNKPDNDLFEPRPKTPPPQVDTGRTDQSSNPSSTVASMSLPTGDLRHEMVEVLHEFTQICISASIRTRSQETLLEKVTSAGPQDVSAFFLKYFHNPIELAQDGTLVTDFIGGNPSPIHFLITQGLLTKGDFDCVLQEIGKKDTFPEQLMRALHQFPGSEGLPWSGEGILSGLFNGHFSFNSNSLNQHRGLSLPSNKEGGNKDGGVSGMTSREELIELLKQARNSPSPPPVKPYSGPVKQEKHVFPESGGHRLGTADDKNSPSVSVPTQFTNQPSGSLQPRPTSVQSDSSDNPPSPPSGRSRDRSKPHPLLARLEKQGKIAPSSSQVQPTNNPSDSTSGPTTDATTSLNGSGIPSTSRLLTSLSSRTSSLSEGVVVSEPTSTVTSSSSSAFVSTSNYGVSTSVQARVVGVGLSQSQPVVSTMRTSSLNAGIASKATEPSTVDTTTPIPAVVPITTRSTIPEHQSNLPSHSNETLFVKVEEAALTFATSVVSTNTGNDLTLQNTFDEQLSETEETNLDDKTSDPDSPPPKAKLPLHQALAGETSDASKLMMDFTFPSSILDSSDLVGEVEDQNDLSGESDNNFDEDLEEMLFSPDTTSPPQLTTTRSPTPTVSSEPPTHKPSTLDSGFQSMALSTRSTNTTQSLQEDPLSLLNGPLTPSGCVSANHSQEHSLPSGSHAFNDAKHEQAQHSPTVDSSYTYNALQSVSDTGTGVNVTQVKLDEQVFTPTSVADSKGTPVKLDKHDFTSEPKKLASSMEHSHPMSQKSLPNFTLSVTNTHLSSKIDTSGSETDEEYRLKLPSQVPNSSYLSDSENSSIENDLESQTQTMTSGNTSKMKSVTSHNPSTEKVPSPSPSLARKSRIPVHVSRKSDSSTLKSRSNSQDSLLSTSSSSIGLKRKLESSPMVSRRAESKGEASFRRKHRNESTNHKLATHKDKTDSEQSGKKATSHGVINKPKGVSPRRAEGQFGHAKPKTKQTAPSEERKTVLDLTDHDHCDDKVHHGMHKLRNEPLLNHSLEKVLEDSELSSLSTPLHFDLASSEHELTQLKPPSSKPVAKAKLAKEVSSRFPDVQISEENESELFEVIAEEVKKWQFLGRYLEMEDEVLDHINKHNHFSGEKCMKMLLEWKRTFGSHATYFKLEEALRNVLHEDLIKEIEEFVPQTCSEALSIVSGDEYTLQLTSNGLTERDSELIKESFESSRSDCLSTAKVTLSYSSTDDSLDDSQLHKYSFCVDLCEDNAVCVVEDLCVCAAMYRHAESIVFLVEYS